MFLKDEFERKEEMYLNVIKKLLMQKYSISFKGDVSRFPTIKRIVDKYPEKTSFKIREIVGDTLMVLTEKDDDLKVNTYTKIPLKELIAYIERN